MATLPPTHTLTQMPNNLTLVVATPKRLGALPVVIIINRLALKELTTTLTPLGGKAPSVKKKQAQRWEVSLNYPPHLFFL